MKTPFKTADRRGRYIISRPVSAKEIIDKAAQLTKQRFRRGKFLQNPKETQRYLSLELAHLEHEEFHVLFLDNQHRIITLQKMFRGTINGSSVHPREVVKAALVANAAAVILAHNHPSGIAEPSSADRVITKQLVEALALIDVRVLDHFVIASSGDTVSFAERGWV